MPHHAQWTSILADAIRSPSPHNTQPWRVRIVDDCRAALYLDATRLMPNEDLTGCFQVSAAGIFIEAVSLLAANLGFELGVKLHEIDLAVAMIPVAQLTLIENESAAPALFDAKQLAARRTSRLSHTGRRIDPATAESLTRLAEHYGQRFGYTAESTLIERVLTRNTQAVFADMNRKPYHDEFVGWLRNEQQAAQTRDGLSHDCMRMSGLDDWVLRRVPWVLRLPGLRGVLSRRYRHVLGQTEHIGWLSGPFWRYGQAIQAGRFFLRFWLALDHAGMGLHPLGNLVTNASAKAWTIDKVSDDAEVWMVFRFGHSAAAPASHRRSLKEVLLD